MTLRNKKSLLFIGPDYHCSFFYRDRLRKNGWKSDILVSSTYPQNLLYSNEGVLKLADFSDSGIFLRSLGVILGYFYYFRLIIKYKYHFYYDGFEYFNYGIEKKLNLEPFQLHLWVAKILGVKIILFPSGCSSEFTKEEFSKFDKGNVCNNCGYKTCNDKINKARLSIAEKYADLVLGFGTFDSPHFKISSLKYKSLDLSVFKPDIKIPKNLKLSRTKNIRILHSFYDVNRTHDGKNIKGSPYIVDAVKRLQREGFNVEYMNFRDISSNTMRYYQAQADIVVEQLIYGWWGSTGVEAMGLGKPLVCYLRLSWKKFFLERYPNYTNLPVIEADTSSIYVCLLYTSPSPRDATLSRMPSSA